ncbi:MAG: GAF domain-containing protein [Gaiellaceae bacterium]
MESATPSEPRLRALLEAGMALASELSLDSVLQRLTELSAELTGARYAALGVLDASGSRLERFITHGLDDVTRIAIGDPPHGRGILGALITDASPLRLHAIADDPRSVGFPANHPPMTSFLGVPVLLRGTAYGNLYLTEKEGGDDFTQEDEELVGLLGSQAAVAIENARVYESAMRWSRQLESLMEVSSAMARETSVDRLLELIAERLHDLLEARLVTVALPSGSEHVRIVAAAGELADEVTGELMPLHESKTGRVLERRRSERVDSVLDDAEVDRVFTRRVDVRAGVWVPLLVQDRAIGVISAYDKLTAPDARFTEDDVRLAEIFATRAAVAVELSERVERDALRRIVSAQELERQRLARELHDETGQALTSILLGLKQLEGKEAPEALAALRELVVATMQDVRRLAVELRPKVLDDFGLVPALERLTHGFSEQTGIVVDLEAGAVSERLPLEVETAIYRIVQEALTNVVKHARAQRVSVLVTRVDGKIKAVIEDDGGGFDPAESGGGIGLVGMRERIELLDVVMPEQSGLEAIPTLLRESPDVKICVLSMQDDPHYVREAFAAGASGYVLKEAADNEVVHAVREVAAGGRYLHPELGARLVAAESDERKRAEDDPLSERESEVLRLLALGHTNQEIAKQLFISVRTAETHRAHIMQKLGLSSRAELVRYALERGLLEQG